MGVTPQVDLSAEGTLEISLWRNHRKRYARAVLVLKVRRIGDCAALLQSANAQNSTILTLRIRLISKVPLAQKAKRHKLKAMPASGFGLLATIICYTVCGLPRLAALMWAAAF